MRGSFGYQTVLGVTSPAWGAGEYEHPVLGLPVAGQHVWGGLRSGGTRSLVIRHFMNEMAGRLLRYESVDDGDFRFRPVDGYAGLCEVGELDGQWGIYQPGAEVKFAFTAGTETARWREAGALDLQLAPCLDGLQFVTPDAEEPLAYFCRAFQVVGGDVSEGFVFHEQVYLRSGRGWALSAYKKRLQGIWIAFATRYTDGTVHWGQLCHGTRGWSFAIVIRSDGPAVLVHRPDAEVSFDDDQYPIRCDVDLGDAGVWSWTTPAGGGSRIPLPGQPDQVPRWSEGVVTQLGAQREVAFGTSWAEAYPTRF